MVTLHANTQNPFPQIHTSIILTTYWITEVHTGVHFNTFPNPHRTPYHNFSGYNLKYILTNYKIPLYQCLF